MTEPDDLAQRAARHQPTRLTEQREVVPWHRCGVCMQDWGEHGCDAHQLAAALAAEQAARARAEEREKKLRGALHGLTSYAVMAEQYVPEPIRTAQHWLIEQAQKAF